MRRCNLACAYCNEFDATSSRVPLEIVVGCIRRLAELGTTVITISGGEPLLHPNLDDIIHEIRQQGSVATLITNGYLLTPERIRRLNQAGLDHLQISIDNVEPDAISKKSLKVLDKKIQWLSQYATFQVNINSVLGASTRPEDAKTVAYVRGNSGSPLLSALCMMMRANSVSSAQRSAGFIGMWYRSQPSLLHRLPITTSSSAT